MRLLGWPLTMRVITSARYLGVDAVELAGLDQRSDDGPVLGAATGACEEGILPGEGEGPDRALDDVVVQLDATVVEEQGQALPAREGVADRLASLVFWLISASFARSHGSRASMIGLLFSWRVARRSSGGRPRIEASTR